MPALDGLRVAVTARSDGGDQVGLLRHRGATVLWLPVAHHAQHGVQGRSLDQVALLDAVAHRHVDALTFTSPRAVVQFCDAAERHGMTSLVRAALQSHVAVVCSGGDTRAALDALGIPAAGTSSGEPCALVDVVVSTLLSSDPAATIRLDDGRLLTLEEQQVLVDDLPVRLTPAPEAVLRVLAQRPGHVVARAQLLGSLPSGTAGSEHAVETAVARLRQAVGPGTVQTLVKRGYRLAVS